MQALRGTGEIAFARDGNEGAQVMEVQCPGRFSVRCNILRGLYCD